MQSDVSDVWWHPPVKQAVETPSLTLVPQFLPKWSVLLLAK